MDWLQFIAALISAVAWPATVGIILCLLRKPILELIPALRKLKLKEFELEFRDELAKVQTPATIAVDEKPKGEEEVVLLKQPSYYHELARISPRAALMEVWMEVEAAASDAFHRRFSASSTSDIRIEPKNLFEVLRSKDVISTDEYHRAETLRILRNRAAHEVELSEISGELIDAYVIMALELAKALKKK